MKTSKYILGQSLINGLTVIVGWSVFLDCKLIHVLWIIPFQALMTTINVVWINKCRVNERFESQKKEPHP